MRLITLGLVAIGLFASVCAPVMADPAASNGSPVKKNTQFATLSKTATPKLKFAAKTTISPAAGSSFLQVLVPPQDAPSPAGLNEEQIPGLDPYATGSQSAQPSSRTGETTGPVHHKEQIFQGLEKFGHDLEKTIKDTAKGTSKLIKTAAEAPDAVVEGTDAVVKGAEKAPGVVKSGAGVVIDDVAFPKDAQTMDYDGDI